nr:uncharacterized protein LOC120962028 [Aegilops tauschii subsp. strangulata]
MWAIVTRLTLKSKTRSVFSPVVPGAVDEFETAWEQLIETACVRTSSEMSAAQSIGYSAGQVSSSSASFGIRLVDQREQPTSSDPQHEVFSRRSSLIAASVHGRTDGVSMADGDLKEEPEVHISSFSCGGGGYI